MVHKIKYCISGFNKVTLVYLCLTLFFSFPLFSQNIDKTLYINNGYFVTIDSVAFPYKTFNKSTEFDTYSEPIVIEEGQIIDLTIINNDSLDHGFYVSHHTSDTLHISAGDTAFINLQFEQAGAYLFYDPYNYPANKILGLSGMIAVKSTKGASPFFWHLRSHQSDLNTQLINGTAFNISDYKPDYYTINGLSKSDLEVDLNAVIKGNVGDTIHIFVVNSGPSAHSIHFHGFHSEIIYSLPRSFRLGWSKDTFPVESMQTYIWEMIPDKAGYYPVHDHNLTAVTGGGYYPGGMFLTMEIYE